MYTAWQMMRLSRAGSRTRTFSTSPAKHSFQHQPPIYPSSLSRWRKRIGEDGAEWLLNKTIEAGRAAGTVDEASLKRVAVDTTVMEKAIARPTDAKLYEKARQ